MKRIVATAAIIFLIFQIGYSQKVMGLVYQKGAQGEDEPVAGANLFWLGTQTAAATGENGVFMIERVAGKDSLVVSFIGMVPDTIAVSGTKNIQILLKPQFLEEITVEGWKPATGLDQSKIVNTSIMGEKELFKAACCNLSESFETNPSVDVAFTDALTGTRQIQMLGLSGPNTMISVENMPSVRGLAASQGIQFIPGTWINSIEVTKGVGSVVNGFESIAGQINVELKKPEDSEKLFVNGYLNQSARSELNVNYSTVTGKRWATTFLLHGSARPLEMDQNDDGFLDFPTGNQFNLINRWVYNNGNGWLGQIGIKLLQDTKVGGEVGFDPAKDKFTTNAYGLGIRTRRVEAWSKIGHQFTGKHYKSIGLQLSVSRHDHDSYYGFTTHNGLQRSGYANLIYQSIIGSTMHKFKTGLSYQFDHYAETLANSMTSIIIRNAGNETATNSMDVGRTEYVPGAFVEYTYDYLDKVSVIAGLRADYHNLFGWIVTPRLHTRYSPGELTTFRFSVGKGTRVANILTENTGILASSRQLIFSGLQSSYAYGFKPDVAWNYGLNFSQDFNLNYRPGTVLLDYFYTDFINQVVADVDQSSREVNFFSLTGRSFSHSLQFQTDYEIAKRLDLRIAYRWLDVQTDYLEGRLRRPLIAANRAFANLAYETRSDWKFDYTIQWTGRQRIPDTSMNAEEFQLGEYSPSFVLMNAQVTKDIQRWSFYVGVENISNYRSERPIIDADNPFSSNFDSSLVWGPIFGRMAYAGFRFKVK